MGHVNADHPAGPFELTAGAALVDDLQAMLKSAGFDRVDIALRESSRAMVREWTNDPEAGKFVVSALITAYKPGT